MTKSPLTKTQRRKVARLYSDGMSPKDIATELGEPHRTVKSFIDSNYLTSNGDYMSKRPMPETKTKSDLSERNAARDMHASGLTVTEIAVRTGRSRSAIRKWISTDD